MKPFFLYPVGARERIAEERDLGGLEGKYHEKHGDRRQGDRRQGGERREGGERRQGNFRREGGNR